MVVSVGRRWWVVEIAKLRIRLRVSVTREEKTASLAQEEAWLLWSAEVCVQTSTAAGGADTGSDSMGQSEQRLLASVVGAA